MKILFADAIPEAIIDSFRDKGDECVLNPDLTWPKMESFLSFLNEDLDKEEVLNYIVE